MPISFYLDNSRGEMENDTWNDAWQLDIEILISAPQSNT